MKNFIAQQLETVYAIFATKMYTWMCAPDTKLHVDYDVRGVAKISAIDKLELDQNKTEVFYVSDLTDKISKRLESGYYKNHGLLISGEGEVLLETFKATSTLEGRKTVMNREEYLASQSYRQDQMRIVYPDGSVELNADFIQRVISRKSIIAKQLPAPESDCADDETYALSAL